MIGHIVNRTSPPVPDLDLSKVPTSLKELVTKSITRLAPKGYSAVGLEASPTVIRIAVVPSATVRVWDRPDGYLVLSLNGGKVSFTFEAGRFAPDILQQRLTAGVQGLYPDHE